MVEWINSSPVETEDANGDRAWAGGTTQSKLGKRSKCDGCCREERHENEKHGERFLLFFSFSHRQISLAQLNGREELTLTVDLQRARTGRGCQLSSLMTHACVCADGSRIKQKSVITVRMPRPRCSHLLRIAWCNPSPCIQRWSCDLDWIHYSSLSERWEVWPRVVWFWYTRTRRKLGGGGGGP
jgi:hypothetical protein